MLSKIKTDMKKYPNEYVLVALMSAFIVTKVQVPTMVGKLVDTLAGKVAMYALAASLLMRHPVLGVVSIIFVYEFIKRSEESTGTYQMRQYEPSEEKRNKRIMEANEIKHDTLEERVVSAMIPYADYTNVDDVTYLPVSTKTHNATKL
jgi:hypothetical protein